MPNGTNYFQAASKLYSVIGSPGEITPEVRRTDRQSSSGKVLISDAGKLLLSQNPPIINCKLLRDFPSYLKFIGAVPSENQPLSNSLGPDDAALENTKTPLELIDSSFESLRKATIGSCLQG